MVLRVHLLTDMSIAIFLSEPQWAKERLGKENLFFDEDLCVSRKGFHAGDFHVGCCLPGACRADKHSTIPSYLILDIRR